LDIKGLARPFAFGVNTILLNEQLSFAFLLLKRGLKTRVKWVGIWHY
jgi:hypothetical protein